MTELTWTQVARWRAARHFLTERVEHDRLLEVVRTLCGVHAQVLSAGELALWVRVDGLKQGQLENMLWTERSLVKTWAMRGTLHLFTADDLPVYVAAMRATRNAYRKAYWLKAFGTTLDEIEAIIAAAYRVLDGQTLTREALAAAIAAAANVPHQKDRLRSGWGEFLKLASYHGHLCFGPSQGQNVTFVRPNQWLQNWRDVPPDEAMRTIFRRYLAAYGPAQRDDFSRWWGIQPAEGRHWIELVRDELAEVNAEGWKAWVLAADVESIESVADTLSVRLLPNFDTYTVAGYHRRESLLAEAFLPRVYRTAGWISPVVLVNGCIQGVWKYEQKRAKLIVTVEAFAPFSNEIKQQIEAETVRLGEFLGLPADLIYGSLA